jgi:transcriptional regulator with XRE-family HTH domain
MTQAELAAALKINRTTLWKLRRDYPGEPSKDASLEEWQAWVGRHLTYDLERRRKSNPLATNQEDTENADSFTSAELRRQKVIKLRLANEVAREELRLIRRETLSRRDCEATIERIRAVTAKALSEMSAAVSIQLAGKTATEVQAGLDSAVRKALDKLAQPETYAQQRP